MLPFDRKGIDDSLIEGLRTGARRLITQAVVAEFETFLASTAELVLPDGRASTPFCPFSICAVFPPAISRRPSPPSSPNLSAVVIARLKSEWEDEY